MSDKKKPTRERPLATPEEARIRQEAREDEGVDAEEGAELEELEMLLCVLEPINHSAALQLGRFGNTEAGNGDVPGELFSKANVAFLAWSGFCGHWDPARVSMAEIGERFFDARSVAVLLLQAVKDVMLGAPPRWAPIMQSIIQGYDVLPPFATRAGWRHEVEAELVGAFVEKTAPGAGRRN